MASVELIAALAVLQFLAFGLMTGMTREKSGVKAPATSGHPDFEKMYRVQMNTLELLVAFFPSLFIAAIYWPSWLVAGLGLIYLIGRLVYWRAYVADPAKRGIGFGLSFFPTLVLTVLALAGPALKLLGLRG